MSFAFSVYMALLIVQRLTELVIARRNEKIVKERGAKEYGKSHYPFIVILHVLFLLSIFAEAAIFNRGLSPVWPVILLLIAAVQILRYWSIFSLGAYWNTKILIVPDGNLQAKGPYRYIRHPNYVTVALEMVLLPALFQCYFTAILFTILNGIMMMVRIPAEEKALQHYTAEKNSFGGQVEK